MLNRFISLTLLLLITITMQGCTYRPSFTSDGPWHMPHKESQEAGAIFGSIQSEGDMYLNLSKIYLHKKGDQFTRDVVILTSNKFIAPNLEPGTYFISGFRAGDYIHDLPRDNFPPIILKPGQLKYFGAYWYETIDGGLFRRDKFSLKPAKTPSEMDMLRWLERISIDTGWEPSIKKRIIKLGGKPITTAKSPNTQKTTK